MTSDLVERDTLGRLFLFGQKVYQGAFLRHVDKLGNLFCIGSRQQNAALQTWQALEQLLHFLMEPHLQAFVKFVDDKVADVIT